jgi:hypothetical protein
MKTWRIEPCTFKTLAALFKMNEKAFRNHLKPLKDKIGEKHGHLYTVKQLIIIFEEYCTPAGIEIIYPEPIPARKRGNGYYSARNHSDAGGLMI